MGNTQPDRQVSCVVVVVAAAAAAASGFELKRAEAGADGHEPSVRPS